MPPDSSCGKLFSNPLSPTSAAYSSASASRLGRSSGKPNSRFCFTVSHGNTEPCCVIMMPLRFGPLRTSPFTFTAPESGGRKPAMMFISVVLPQPEGPTMATNSPSFMSKSRPSMTCRRTLSFWKLLRMSWTWILVGIAPPYDFHALQQPHEPVEHQADEADDDHAGDDQVIAVTGIA